MPNISIKEKDLSWFYQQRARGNVVVYTPGLSTFGPTEPTLVSGETDLSGVYAGPVDVRNHYSYQVADSLLKSGIDVLFHRVVPDGATKAKYQQICTYEIYNISDEVYTFTVGDTTEIAIPVGDTATDVSINVVDKKSCDEALNKSNVVNKITGAFCTIVDDSSNSKITAEFVNNSDVDVTLTFGGVPTTIVAGDTMNIEKTYSSTSDKNSILEVLKPYNITKEFPTNIQIYVNNITMPAGALVNDNGDCLVIEAKYEGTYGNKISIKVSGPSDAQSAIRYFYVYEGSPDKGAILETLIVDFKDYLSGNFWDNISSKYINFDLRGDFDTSWLSGNSPVITLSGGLDGDPNTDIRAKAVAKLLDGEFFSEIEDNYLYDFDIAINGTFTSYDDYEDTPSTDPNYKLLDNALVSVAKSKGKAVYLISGLKGMNANNLNAYLSTFNTSYAAGIGPFATSKLVSTGVKVSLPGYYPLLVEWGNSCAQGNPIWFAPAGTMRAQCKTVDHTEYPVGKAVLDLWQNSSDISDTGCKIIPIVNLKQYGYVIYGDDTLLHNDPTGATSVLQGLGTRVLVNKIKGEIFNISLSLQFDQLSDDLFLKFRTLVSSYLDQLVYQRGLSDYDITIDKSITDESLARRIVPVTVKISPIPAVKDFDITLEISRAGVTFSE